MVYSLLEIFGSLPVEPSLFRVLDPRLRFIETPIEGGNFCLSCGTLSPHTPRSHHNNCLSYSDKDTYDVYENPLGVCPDCGSHDGLSIDSWRDLQLSRISCIDCTFSLEGNVDEETLIKKFKAIYEKK